MNQYLVRRLLWACVLFIAITLVTCVIFFVGTIRQCVKPAPGL